MGLLSKIEEDNFTGKFLRYGLSLVPYSKWKLGNDFKTYYNLLFNNEKLKLEDIQNYQFKELKRVLDQAYNYTSFYKKKYDEVGFHPSQVKSLKDIELIPVLTRLEVRGNGIEMIDNRFKGKLYKSVTSGTTATPLTIYRNRTTAKKEWAAICYQWSRVGYKPGDGRIEFRGNMHKSTTFIHLKHERVLRINIVEMSEDNITSILNAIKKTKYSFIHGYPSAIHKFFSIVLKKNKEFPSSIKIKAFLLASENIFDWQIELFKEIIPTAKVICHYGQAEKVALGAWNEDQNYHFIPSYSLTEIKANKLIGTSFISDIMPLIRYEVNDQMELASELPVGDKMLFPVVSKISGRMEDITYTTEGKPVPPALVTFPFKKLKLIEACRIVQVNKSEFEVLVQSIEQEQELRIELNELETKMKLIYGENAKFSFSITSKIPLSKNGKFKWVECKNKELWN